MINDQNICLGPEYLQQALTEPCPSCSIMLLVKHEALITVYDNMAVYSSPSSGSVWQQQGVKLTVDITAEPIKKKS